MTPEQLRDIAALIEKIEAIDLDFNSITLGGDIPIHDEDGDMQRGKLAPIDGGVWLFEAN